MSTALAPTERQRLVELEDTVERGLETFVEVGRALMEIRDQRLYRADYDTFEAYCRERWGWSRRHANRQIKAAETVESIAGDGTHGSQNDDGQGTDPNDPKYRIRPKRPLPKSERVARPLTKLPEDEQAEAWEEAVETAPESEGGEKRVTASHVEETVEKRQADDTDEPRQHGPTASTGDEETLEEMVRRAMEWEENDAAKIAKRLPISYQTFGRARYIVMLADDPVLGDEARRTVQEALDYMNRHGQVAHPYRMVEDLVEGRFGSSSNRKSGIHRSAERHMRNFERAYGTVVQSCQQVRSLDVPILPNEKGGEVLSEIEEAIDALKSLRNKVKEAVQ